MGHEISRRVFLVGIAAASSTALAGCAPKPEAIQPLLPEPTKPMPDRDRILLRARELNIASDAKEKDLWNSLQFVPGREKRPITEENLKIAEDGLNEIISAMGRSKNPYFSNSAKTFYSLTLQNKLNFRIQPIGQSNRKDRTLIATTLTEQNNVPTHYVIIDTNMILNESNPLHIASLLAHEAEHIKNAEALFSQLPNSSTKERVNAWENKAANRQEKIAEEARGYAAQANAIIYQTGLGYSSFATIEDMKITSEFIRLGNNPESQAWRTFIADYFGY